MKLRANLLQRGLSAPAVHEVVNLAKQGHREIACTKFMELKLKVPNLNDFTVNHPNEYFDKSFGIVNGNNGNIIDNDNNKNSNNNNKYKYNNNNNNNNNNSVSSSNNNNNNNNNSKSRSDSDMMNDFEDFDDVDLENI